MIDTREYLACSCRERLVHELEDLGIRAPLLEAFGAIPRHAFLENYYRQEEVGNGYGWQRVGRPAIQAPPECWLDWYSAIYANEALVTQVDAHGRPTSSSSMPQAMEIMLEALALAPGHRVLEIGTGTGYNAALLASLVGTASLVTTLEIDAQLATVAKQRLETIVGPGVHVLPVDGLTWCEPGRSYDRIIATGSFPTLPCCWWQMLAPGGILVMELRGGFAGALVTMQKDAEGSGWGRFVPGWEASFMRLYSTPQDQARRQIKLEGPCIEQGEPDAGDSALAWLENADLALWLQCSFPSLQLRRQYALRTNALTLYLIDEAQKTTLSLRQQEQEWRMEVYGTYPLWSEIARACQQWQQAGCPDRNSYRLRIDVEGQLTLLAR
jgi:protein-L-isoaspartate O-methyltransferase